MYSLAIIFFSQLSHLATIVVVTGLNQYHLAPVPVIFLLLYAERVYWGRLYQKSYLKIG